MVRVRIRAARAACGLSSPRLISVFSPKTKTDEFVKWSIRQRPPSTTATYNIHRYPTVTMAITGNRPYHISSAGIFRELETTWYYFKAIQ